MINKLFEQALGITHPWYIENVTFAKENSRLDININFSRGAKFTYGSNEGLPVHDTVRKQWRHLNFFEHECYLVCRVPRVKLPDGKVKRVKVPWEGEGKGFTLLFEALMLQLCVEMPVNAVARLLKVDDNKIWRILNAYVEKARKNLDLSDLSVVGVDETSMKKHHDYVSLVVDIAKGKTVFVAEGKDSNVLEKFRNCLEEHGGSAENITDISFDMSPAFISGAEAHFPDAAITFDKFHILKMINKAVGEVRKKEAKVVALLKGTKGLFDRNRCNMTEKQLKYMKEKLELRSLNLKTVRAYHLKEAFQEIYKANTADEFKRFLEAWYSWARRCRLEPIKEVAATIRKHWSGVLRWYHSRISNGILEGLNSLVQSAKSKARGFKTFRNFSTIIFLITGDLDLQKINPLYVCLK